MKNADLGLASIYVSNGSWQVWYPLAGLVPLLRNVTHSMSGDELVCLVTDPSVALEGTSLTACPGLIKG